MMVYIASPYSHKEKAIMALRELVISKVTAELILKYKITPFGPITQSHRLAQLMPVFDTGFSYWKDIDLDAIDHCDEVWVVKMDGWKKSVGVTEEVKHAKKQKIPVRYVNPRTLRFVGDK